MGTTARNFSILVIFWWWSFLVLLRLSSGQDASHGAVLSSFSRHNIRLRPFDWAYMRVELPPWFSALTINFLSDANIDEDGMKHMSSSKLPVLCFKSGSPPIPDMSVTSLSNSSSGFILNGYVGIAHNLSGKDQCIPFQKNLTVVWTNEQISSGIWYIGFFNGLGSARTQSQMISRGTVYTFSTSITVEGCSTTAIWGPYCNQTIDMISCTRSSRNKYTRSLSELLTGSLSNPEHYRREKIYSFSKRSTTENDEVSSNTTSQNNAENMMTCYSSDRSSCLSYGESNIFYLDIVGMASHFVISASDFELNQTSSTDLGTDKVLLMTYARYNAVPLQTAYDFSGDLSINPLIIKSPKAGRWYITLTAFNQIEVNGSTQETYFNGSFCYSLKWQVPECLSGKAGFNCTWQAHTLQRTPRYSNVPYEAYYLPADKSVSDGHTFSLENLLSNDSNDQVAWTYLFIDIPAGAAGTTMHIRLSSDAPEVYEIYSRFGGLPSIDTWDFFINSTTSSNDSIILASDGSKGRSIDFYVPYAREGIWCVGLKHPFDSFSKYHSTMLIALDGCPRNCNSNGKCRSAIDESGSTIYSYCGCDRDHGGFDCNDVLISPRGHAWHSIFLIASNAAAILPAFLALRQKAYSEWVLFTASGISSGLYHACDVGTWCVLSFGVLQFMDFWLSFMAVVSTFIYLATIDEASKRAIHTTLAILTALMAITGATRSANIGLVIAIGTLGLLFGWFLEFSTTQRVIRCPTRFDLNIPERWQSIREWFHSLWTNLLGKFHFQFLFLGFVTLALAATSWKLETNKSYWIWHSLWHITIYTSSFFFLYSLRGKSSNEHQQPVYELTRQDSSSRM